jgi:hypothetical protein
MSDAAATQNGRRGYQKHGDSYRQRLLKERGVAAIDGRSRSGKQAKDWRRYALQRKGGKTCPIDVREKIEAGCFYLWRSSSFAPLSSPMPGRTALGQQARAHAAGDQCAIRHGYGAVAAN